MITRKKDFTKNGVKYDLILAANGYHPLRDYQQALCPGGIYVVAGGKPAQMFEVMVLGAMMTSDGKKMVSMLEEPNQKDLAFIGICWKPAKSRSSSTASTRCGKARKRCGILARGMRWEKW